MGAQEKTKLGAVAGQLGLEPLLDSRERASWATSPPVLTSVTVLEGKRTQVLVLHPGRGPPEQSPQAVELARITGWSGSRRGGRWRWMATRGVRWLRRAMYWRVAAPSVTRRTSARERNEARGKVVAGSHKCIESESEGKGRTLELYYIYIYIYALFLIMENLE